MIADLLIPHVENAIARALCHESCIDESVLHLTGFSTGVMRRLVSNLCQLPEATYLECGLYAGATFCAAINNNPLLRAIGIENFSQPFGKEGIREELEANVARYRVGDVMTIDADCFAIDAADILGPVDIFFYDGEHSFESQSKALPHFFDALAGSFIFIVDDAHWQSVAEGTQAGFDELRGKVRIEREWSLDGQKPQDDPVWWNGVKLYVCAKV